VLCIRDDDRFLRPIALASLLWMGLGFAWHVAPASAATPSSGTLSTSTPAVTWTGATLAGANVNESTCNEGVTCDTYTLTLAPGDYTGRRITVGIGWLNPADDFDLYIHKDAANGPIVAQSAGGAPSTTERASIAIDPPVVTASQVYVVHVVAFTVATPVPYSGDASLVSVPPPRVATYLPGTMHFSQNVTLRAPVAGRDCEPSLRVDVRGNCYVSAIRGVPAGVDMWRFDLTPGSPTFDPGLQSPLYLGQPDAFLPQDPNDPNAGGADGGGDVDLATSFPTSPDSTPVVTMVSLAVANISSAYSFDRGAHFTLSPATAIAPSDDRQWIEADGPDKVYLFYRAPVPATGLFAQRSDDHGRTYLSPGVVNPSGSTPGYIDVNHANGSVYIAHASSASLSVARSTDGGATWRNTTADNTTSHGALFDVVKVGDDGTVYALWSDQTNIYLAHSTDGAVTWSDKIRVNDNSVYKTNLFPWLEAGSAGRVAVVWYGTTAAANEDDADWHVLFAQTLNATAPNPTFYQQEIGDHVIHGSNISLGGLTGSANRNLCDYFQVAIDPQGAAVVAYTDDHNDFDGHTYVTRQLDGTSLYANANGNGTVSPIYPPPLPTPNPGDPQVTDFLHDAIAALLQPIPGDSPYDVLSIKYGCEDAGGNPMLAATMKVSSLAPIPPATNWRMNFTANAPGGVSDRGDQFWVSANTDNALNPSYRYGTAVRNSDGSLSYTSRGSADFGVFDAASQTITVKVAIAKLNALMPAGHSPIGVGSVLWGLRGSIFTDQANGTSLVRDITRGGTSFTFPNCSATPTLLAMLRAEDSAQGIRVLWEFTDPAAFSDVGVERSTSAEGPWAAIAVEWGRDGAATTALDRGAASGQTYAYRLTTRGADGQVLHFGPISATHGVDPAAPLASFLRSSGPNPFASASSVEFQVARPGFVELSVVDPNGRRVRTLQAGPMAPGRYTRTWDGRSDRFTDAAAGIYFFVLNTGDGVKSRRVALVR